MARDKNVKDLRKFLGFTSYYRKFVKDYGKIAKPLNDLLVGHPTNKSVGKKTKPKAKTPWRWTYIEQQARDTLIEKLISPPILAYADYSLPFEVHTDAILDYSLRAILHQRQNGIDRVIAYASRGLRGAEKLYPAHKRVFGFKMGCSGQVP